MQINFFIVKIHLFALSFVFGSLSGNENWAHRLPMRKRDDGYSQTTYKSLLSSLIYIPSHF